MFLRPLFFLPLFTLFLSCPVFLPSSTSSSSSFYPPFPSSSIPLMTQYFLNNLDYNSTGGIVASPDIVTPVGGGTYFYDWERDGALSMRAFMEINDYDLDKIKINMDKYLSWVQKVQSKISPFGYNVLIEPKYTFPEGDVYTGGWGRPQTDGPGLRATTIILYAKSLVKGGRIGEAKNIWENVIKKDLDWIKNGWSNTKSFDLWEDLESDSLFWNKVNQRRALFEGIELGNYFKDDVSDYTREVQKIEQSIETHWNGELYLEAKERLRDGAVIIGFNEAFSENSPLFLDSTSMKVASTVESLIKFFCKAYRINEADDSRGLAGILIGRYETDVYQGGNPWILITAELGKLLYRAAISVKKERLGDGIEKWKSILGIVGEQDFKKIADAFLKAGDSVMSRIEYHVRNDDYHLAEQLDKNTGIQSSARDLTWSYASVLVALKKREEFLKSA